MSNVHVNILPNRSAFQSFQYVMEIPPVYMDDSPGSFQSSQKTRPLLSGLQFHVLKSYGKDVEMKGANAGQKNRNLKLFIGKTLVSFP